MPSVLSYAISLVMIGLLAIVAWRPWCLFSLGVFNRIFRALGMETVSTQMCGQASNSLPRFVNWIEHLKLPSLASIHFSISRVLLAQIVIVVTFIILLVLLWNLLNLLMDSLQDMKMRRNPRTSNLFVEFWDSFTTRLLILCVAVILTVRMMVGAVLQVIGMVLRGKSSSQKKPKRTILFLAAEPTGLNQLRLGEEMREIEDCLQLGRHRASFSLQTRTAVRPRDLIRTLLRYRPAIVHFSGHGARTGELILEDDRGASLPIRPEELSRILQVFNRQIKCVILNACYSDPHAKAIARYIKYVIGTTEAIVDKAAVAFSVGFYQALGEGETIKTSYELGRQHASVYDSKIEFKLRFVAHKARRAARPLRTL